MQSPNEVLKCAPAHGQVETAWTNEFCDEHEATRLSSKAESNLSLPKQTRPASRFPSITASITRVLNLLRTGNTTEELWRPSLTRGNLDQDSDSGDHKDVAGLGGGFRSVTVHQLQILL